MKILITGGCKNGKSYYAQKWVKKAAGNGRLLYVATMRPMDSEDNERIARHRSEREGWGFVTIEQPTDIIAVKNYCEPEDSILLDSTTALLMNEMFYGKSKVNKNAHEKIIPQLIELADVVENIAVVSDWIYSDAERYEELTENYRYSLGMIDRALAKNFDSVCEVSYGALIYHKGEELL